MAAQRRATNTCSEPAIEKAAARGEKGGFTQQPQPRGARSETGILISWCRDRLVSGVTYMWTAIVRISILGDRTFTATSSSMEGMSQSAVGVAA